ncbi:unnamed protein product [Acanthocheilonema viteae]|uniref:Protein kinase domain-containing protein n=1 Tax=Acanthocheilonema viteae TaxID=6277 RepID=A0A498T135_ACAVI|nr:unnamed protein product [Acanthocheilonema viteae]
MLVGLNGKATKMIFLVDFGMCRTYIRKNMNGSIAIRPEREKAFVRGILRYCSLRVHKRQDVCRADDLWSLVYILIDLTVGLPWRDIKVEKPVAEQKETISDAKLFNGCPEEWIKIMEHIRSLRYNSRPNYKLIYDYLQETLVRFQISYSDPWDWDLVVLPEVQHTTETRSELKNPFQQIINALQSSFSLNSALSTKQQSATQPLSKQRRLLAMEYDPSFPTTNPANFEKNDIGI